MSKHDSGNGDVCPLFPEHGRMTVLTTTGKPPKQWCPHVFHDGPPKGPPPSRSMWPLYGFEETVTSYLARLDQAIKRAALPDLADVEVK